MRLASLILFAVSAIAQIAGLSLLLIEARSATAALRRWETANPEGNVDGSWGQLLELNPVIAGLLGKPSTRLLAVALVAIGLLTGIGANFTSLGA